MKYIFLDFDGVLHTMNDYMRSENLFQYNHNLMSMLKKIKEKHDDITIVFSTSWRLDFNIDYLKKMLGNEICTLVKEFDTTVLKNYKSIIGYLEYADEPEYQNNRYEEISEYLENKKIKFGDYVVIDDSFDLFFKVHKIDDKKYDVIPLIMDSILLMEISEDFTNYNGENIFNELTEKEKEFNKSFINTFKIDFGESYLSEDDVEKAIKILN